VTCRRLLIRQGTYWISPLCEMAKRQQVIELQVASFGATQARYLICPFARAFFSR